MLQIAAICYISHSEIITVQPWITREFIENNPKEFKQILFDLGMDINYPVEEQDVIHRNRFGNINSGLRWVGNERCDKSWIESGFASTAVVDKSKNSKLLIDIYRMRGLVESE